jgi:integrase
MALILTWIESPHQTRGGTGRHRHPERFSRQFLDHVRQARKALGEELLPVIRLHDLRHTHATLLLAAGEPVKVVSERLGHASATITLTGYQHVHPGMGREAAARFAALLDG